MRVLVTGGAGFIGSHVVDALAEAGHTPRIFDVRPSPYPEHDGVDTVVADLLDPVALREAAAGCDAIAHLAAAADVGLVAADPRGAEELNVRGTLNVLEAARATGARVLYASTIWAYSDVAADDVDEDTRLAHPAHFYTATKLAGEMYCRSYRELFDVDTTILRFGIPYGPRARPAAVLPIFVAKALAGEPLTIAGDGAQTRRFVYVEDIARGVVAALTPVASGRTYNLVGDEDTSVREIAEAVATAVGHVEVVHTPGRSGDFAGVRVSCARAATELGWRATTPFADGVARYVTWYRDQEPIVSTPGADAEPPARDSLAPTLHGSVRDVIEASPARPAGRIAATVAAAVVAVIVLVTGLQSAGVHERQSYAVATLTAVTVLAAVTVLRVAGGREEPR